MKTWWKNLWARRPKLSRGWKLVRNLALSVAGAYLIWSFWGYPLPAAEMAFRRLERQHLLSPASWFFPRRSMDRAPMPYPNGTGP